MTDTPGSKDAYASKQDCESKKGLILVWYGLRLDKDSKVSWYYCPRKYIFSPPGQKLVGARASSSLNSSHFTI